MVSKLSLKQRNFWKSYVKCKDLATAAKAAGSKGKDNNSLKVIGHGILTSLNLSMGELLDAEGLTDQAMAQPMWDGLRAEKAMFATWEGKFTDEKWVPDHPTRSKFLEQYHRLKGNFIDRHELSGKDGGDIIVSYAPSKIGSKKKQLNIDE